MRIDTEQTRPKGPRLRCLLILVVGVAVASQGELNEEMTMDVARLAGRVVDRAGQPIGHAKVTLYKARAKGGETPLPLPVEVLDTTFSDASGLFSVTWKRSYVEGEKEVTEQFVVAQRQGYAPGVDYLRSFESSDENKIVLSKANSVAGMIVNEAGYGVGNAGVHIYPIKGVRQDAWLPALLCSTEASSVKTDARGRFSFDGVPEEANVHLYVTAAGYLDKSTWYFKGGQTGTGRFPAGTQDIVLAMPPISGIRARVVDKSTGKPMSEFKMGLARKDGDAGAPEYFNIFVDDKGRFDINCVAATYEVRYDPENIFPERYGEPTSIVVEKGRTTEVEMKVVTMAQLLIKVNHIKTGEAIPRVGVGLEDANTGERVRADSRVDSDRGLTCFYLRPGKYVISSLSKDGKALLREKPEEITVESGGKYQRNFLVDVGIGYLGKVVDAVNEPVAGADVYLLPGNVLHAQTGADGTFTFTENDFARAVDLARERKELKPENIYPKYYVYVRDVAKNRAGFVEVRLYGSGVTQVVVSESFEVSGSVVDGSGTPIAGAVVAPRVRIDSEHYRFGDEEQFITDDDGYYRIACVPYKRPHDYRYLVTAGGDGLSQAHLGVGAVLKNGTGTFNVCTVPDHEVWAQLKDISAEIYGGGVRLRPFVLRAASLSLSGTIVDILGGPMEEASVSIMGGGQPTFEPITTQGDGRFVFEGLCEGKVRLNVKSEWFPNRGRTPYDYYPVDADVNAGAENIRIIMAPKKALEEKPASTPADSGLVEVTVVDSDVGGPVGGAAVTFQGGSLAGNATVYTNASGIAYIILQKGTYSLVAVGGRQDYRAARVGQDILVEGGQDYSFDTQIKHKAGFGGIVVDEAGRPVGGAFFELMPFYVSGRDFTTQADGKFSASFEPAPTDLRSAEGPACWIIRHAGRKLGASLTTGKEYERDVVVRLQPMVSIMGRVTDAGGSPLKAAVAVLPYYGKYKKEGDAFAAASTDAKGHYELLVPPDLPGGFVYKLSFSAQGRYRQYHALDMSQMSAGQVITKDVVLK